MAGRKRKGNSVQGGALFSDGVPCTDPDKEAAKAAKTEKDKIAATSLKEERIEQIMSIMRQVATKSGAPTWNKKVSRALAMGWGLTNKNVTNMACEASNRIRAEVLGTAPPGEVLSLRDNLLHALQKGILQVAGTNDTKAMAVYGPIIAKITDGPTRVEVTVKTKEPTPVDAAAAVTEMFGKKVSYSGSGEEPADSTESAGDTPKK